MKRANIERFLIEGSCKGCPMRDAYHCLYHDIVLDEPLLQPDGCHITEVRVYSVT
jgi:hypothetical protein